MTTTISPRALTLAASIGWRHVTADPVRALLLAGRVLPAPLRGGLRLAGPYGRAALLWGAGDRPAALAALAASPRRQAAFALAAGQPAAAAEALERLPGTDPARPVLTARLAWREGRLTDALGALDGARGRQARRLRRALAPQQAFLAARQATPLAPPVTPAPSSEGQPMIVASLGRIATETGHDHEARHAGAAAGRVTPGRERVPGRARPGGEPIPGRVLHLVSDALPSVSAGYTIRTHEIVRAQRAAGLDPHVATRCGFPVTQGILDGRRLVEVDGVPYHRLLPWLLPGHGDADPKLAALAEKLAAALTERTRPAVLHAASNFANARIALALGQRYGLPVVYEVRGFWEDTWLSRHPDGARLAEQRALPAQPRRGDRVHAGGRPGRDARRRPCGRRSRPAACPRTRSSSCRTRCPGTSSSPLPGAGNLRAELGIEPDEYVAGIVSSLTQHEGIGTLLEATAILRARGVPARALIVGDGPERAALQRQAAGPAWRRRPFSPAACPRRKYANSTRSLMFSSSRARRTGSVSS